MADSTANSTHQAHQDLTVLKELSDIKASLSVNTTETANIKSAVGEIKTDIREIKSDFVNRREYNDGLTTIREEISLLKKIVYGAVGLILLAVFGAVISNVIIN